VIVKLPLSMVDSPGNAPRAMGSISEGKASRVRGMDVSRTRKYTRWDFVVAMNGAVLQRGSIPRDRQREAQVSKIVFMVPEETHGHIITSL